MKKISVLMGIYNCEKTLKEAVDSLYAQTCTDWELILCDDGSSDGTYAVAEELRNRDPERITLLKNETNMGLNHTLNKCLSAAKGEFIARMDGDDTCSPERFEKERKALEAEPKLALVSTGMSFFDEEGTWGEIHHPERPVPRDFANGSPFCHAPCMMRKSALTVVNGYSEAPHLLRVEDYHLWIKLYAAGFTGRNLPETLYAMRDDRNARNRRTFATRLNEAYVRALCVQTFGLPKYLYLKALRPILVGLLPEKVYDRLHRGRLQK